MLSRTSHRPTNWLGMTFALALIFSTVAFAATEIAYQDANGNTQPVRSTNPLVAARVSAPTGYRAEVASSSIKNLSAIASWTLPCALQIQFNNVVFYSTATTTTATVQSGQRAAQYDTIWVTPASTTFDLSFIASSTSASAAVTVWPLVP